MLCQIFTYSMLQREQRQHENVCQEADSSPLRRRTLSFACHCFIIRQHMLERGGRAHQLPITHHDRKSLDCHGLMSCLPVICGCVCVCLKVCSLTLCLSAYMHFCLCVCVCVCVCSLSLHTCQSSIPSGIRFPMIAKGGVSVAWQREGVRQERKNRENRWSEIHRCLHSFSARLSAAFLLVDRSEAQVWNSPLNTPCSSFKGACLCACEWLVCVCVSVL